MREDTKVSVTDLITTVEDLRRADAQLSRRMSAAQAPNHTDRAALRIIIRDAEANEPTTPRELASQLSVSTAAVSNVIRRLSERGQIVVAAHPTDARSKILLPSESAQASTDDLTDRLAVIAETLDTSEARSISRFLRLVTREIDRLP
ncbi:MAG: MarR family winged helix-turn-helix transcriptional regulator [Actinomycetota bacterium]